MTLSPPLQLDLQKGIRPAARVDYVVLDTLLAEIRHAVLQRRLAGASARLLQEKLAVAEGHDDVVVAVAVPAGLGAFGEAPLRDDDALVLDQGLGRGLWAGHGELRLIRWSRCECMRPRDL